MGSIAALKPENRMQIYYSVQNLRALQQTPEIQLRPITILVGRNSAGKSTFLRTFPLLRQSIEVRSSAPVLWYGSYVDFGDFKTAVTDRDLSKDVVFGFSLRGISTKTKEESDWFQVQRRLFNRYNGLPHPDMKDVSFKIHISGKSNKTKKSKIEFNCDNNGVCAIFEFDQKGIISNNIIIGDNNIKDILPQDNRVFFGNDLFSAPAAFLIDSQKDRDRIQPVSLHSRLSKEIFSILKKKVPGNISSRSVDTEVGRFLNNSKIGPGQLQKFLKETNLKSFKSFYQRQAELMDDKDLKTLNVICNVNYAMESLTYAFHHLSSLFENTTYLSPARARAERFYRLQELEVSEIASDGSNLAMALAALTRRDLDGFSLWVRDIFGFGISITESEGHTSIQLTKDGLAVNLADTGYGISQILPVLAQIWWSTQKPRRREGRDGPLIAMEQPELHLHPAHQAKIADVLVSATRASSVEGKRTTFVVETHSEALINRLGELIETGKVSPDDVQVVIFSSDGETSDRTTVELSKFNGDGSLENWPFGFFNY